MSYANPQYLKLRFKSRLIPDSLRRVDLNKSGFWICCKISIFNRMPFGLNNATRIFTLAMNNIQFVQKTEFRVEI